MAISERMSGPNDWMQFYQQQNFSTQPPAPPGRTGAGAGVGAGASMFTVDGISNATVVTTTAAPGTTSSPVGAMNPGTGHLSPEGGVAKPVRRRSRASRRTPTTIMNTDTANFRAMVQQFTGGPTAPFAAEPARGVLNFGFGHGAPSLSSVNPAGAPMAPLGSFHFVQSQPQRQQQQQLHQNELRDILNVNPRLGNYIGGANLEGSQAYPRPSSSTSNDSTGAYNMFR